MAREFKNAWRTGGRDNDNSEITRRLKTGKIHGAGIQKCWADRRTGHLVVVGKHGAAIGIRYLAQAADAETANINLTATHSRVMSIF